MCKTFSSTLEYRFQDGRKTKKKKDNSLQKIGSEINRNNNYVSVVFITV